MSKMSIRCAEYAVQKIFSDDFVFTIPLYQRAYAWTTEESEELFQDLLRAMGNVEGPIDDVAPYFLGSIVLIKGDEPDAEVIDGQQRLTTLTMLLAALRSLIPSGYVDGLLRLGTKLSGGEASYDYQAVSIEHVLPQRPAENSNWVRMFPSKEMRDRYVHRLGNLVLLSRGKNMRAENVDFDEKKQRYFSVNGGISPFVITTQVLQQREWTPTVIEQCQNLLIGKLKALWNL